VAGCLNLAQFLPSFIVRRNSSPIKRRLCGSLWENVSPDCIKLAMKKGPPTGRP
jgi:hypothetical protein